MGNMRRILDVSADKIIDNINNDDRHRTQAVNETDYCWHTLTFHLLSTPFGKTSEVKSER